METKHHDCGTCDTQGRLPVGTTDYRSGNMTVTGSVQCPCCSGTGELPDEAAYWAHEICAGETECQVRRAARKAVAA